MLKVEQDSLPAVAHVADIVITWPKRTVILALTIHACGHLKLRSSFGFGWSGQVWSYDTTSAEITVITLVEGPKVIDCQKVNRMTRLGNLIHAFRNLRPYARSHVMLKHPKSKSFLLFYFGPPFGSRPPFSSRRTGCRGFTRHPHPPPRPQRWSGRYGQDHAGRPG